MGKGYMDRDGLGYEAMDGKEAVFADVFGGDYAKAFLGSVMEAWPKHYYDLVMKHKGKGGGKKKNPPANKSSNNGTQQNAPARRASIRLANKPKVNYANADAGDDGDDSDFPARKQKRVPPCKQRKQTVQPESTTEDSDASDTYESGTSSAVLSSSGVLSLVLSHKTYFWLQMRMMTHLDRIHQNRVAN